MKHAADTPNRETLTLTQGALTGGTLTQGSHPPASHAEAAGADSVQIDPAETAPVGEVDLDLVLVLGHCTRGVGERLREGVTPEALLAAEPTLLASLNPAVARRLAACTAPAASARRQLQRRLSDCGARLLPIRDARYPTSLREIPDPPPWLFCRGDPQHLAGPALAMVGSRRASHAGLTLAGELAQRLATGGYTICSGLALGIDAAAHRGALQSGTTVAVLGTGIDVCYPGRHRRLLDSILERGCVLSELPPGTSPQRGQFPRRNRIISGLCEATIIVEAALPSGSLHTAAAALEQGREVFVLPWSVLHRGGAGCLQLLRDGATPLTSLEELEEHFPLLAADLFDGDSADARLLHLIGDAALDLDALQAACGLALPALLEGLTRLELSGELVQRDGRYCRAHGKPCSDRFSC